MADRPVVIRAEKYVVTGASVGYIIETLGFVPVHRHIDGLAEGSRLSGTGGSDPRTNAQRGVVWLKNRRMVQETTVAG